MKILKHSGIVRTNIPFAILVLGCTMFSSPSYASDELQPGSRYKIVGSVYLMAVYNDLNNRQLTRETARAYLHSELYADKSHVAFQRIVPVGAIMTILGPAPKIWHLPFFASRYFVRLDPDPSIGLDIVLELNRGIDGNLDGLNPELFARSE